MLRDGQQVRGNLTGLRVGSVVFHARLPRWALLSAWFRTTRGFTEMF